MDNYNQGMPSTPTTGNNQLNTPDDSTNQTAGVPPALNNGNAYYAQSTNAPTAPNNYYGQAPMPPNNGYYAPPTGGQQPPMQNGYYQAAAPGGYYNQPNAGYYGAPVPNGYTQPAPNQPAPNGYGYAPPQANANRAMPNDGYYGASVPPAMSYPPNSGYNYGQQQPFQPQPNNAFATAGQRRRLKTLVYEPVHTPLNILFDTVLIPITMGGLCDRVTYFWGCLIQIAIAAAACLLFGSCPLTVIIVLYAIVLNIIITRRRAADVGRGTQRLLAWGYLPGFLLILLPIWNAFGPTGIILRIFSPFIYAFFLLLWIGFAPSGGDFSKPRYVKFNIGAAQ